MKSSPLFWKAALLAAIFAIGAVTAQSQIEMETPSESEAPADGTSSTEGFFVDGGKTKLAAMDCYTFDNLTVSFDIDESWFEYERIELWLFVGSMDDSDTYMEYDEYDLVISAEEMARFKGKSYAYFSILKDADPAAKSDFLLYKRVPLTRSILQYCELKSMMDESEIRIKAVGFKVVGQHEKTYLDRSGNYITKMVNDYEEVKLKKFEIPMKNRLKEGTTAKKREKIVSERAAAGDPVPDGCWIE